MPGTTADYHEDHLVPLCVGGHSSDPGNLWPQPTLGAWTDKVKDQLEASVCRWTMTLQRGQDIFMKEPDWRKAYIAFANEPE